MNKNSGFADEKETLLCTIERDEKTQIRVRYCRRGSGYKAFDVRQFFRAEEGDPWRHGKGLRVRVAEAEKVIDALARGIDIALDLAELPEEEAPEAETLEAVGAEKPAPKVDAYAQLAAAGFSVVAGGARGPGRASRGTKARSGRTQRGRNG